MVKHTQTIRRQIADEFEYVWPFCEIGAKRVKVKFEGCQHVTQKFEVLWKKPRFKLKWECYITIKWKPNKQNRKWNILALDISLQVPTP